VLAWRGGWSIGVLQRVLDVTPRDGFEAREDAAVLLGCAGRRGDRGGEAGELEVVCERGNCSSNFQMMDKGFGIGFDLLRGEKNEKRGERGSRAFYGRRMPCRRG
jgi:hypothetical protein